MRLLHGDCVEVMRGLPECSVDAIVTDPPYGLEFMGKEWDNLTRNLMRAEEGSRDAERVAGYEGNYAGRRSKLPDYSKTNTPAAQAWHEAWAREALRVLKPGGHLLAFGGTRTYHRMACAIEDAGFEIRDSIHWVYGSGFPKSLDVAKAMTAHQQSGKSSRRANRLAMTGEGEDAPMPTAGLFDRTDERSLRAPRSTPPTRANLTDEARRWEGWGTALKPAHEPVVVARKPLVGTVAGNVLVYGTGGLNIDGCRVGTEPRNPGFREPSSSGLFGSADNAALVGYESPSGRWPANVVFDRAAGEALDQQSGERPSAGEYTKSLSEPERPWAPFGGTPKTGKAKRSNAYANETGGASRFFTQADFGPDDWPFVYQAKPSRKERNAGLDGLEEKQIRRHSGGEYAHNSGSTASSKNGGASKNHHPTVKPVALMRHLVRLVTPPGGTVLDPFAGSGTTLVAAVLEGMSAVGCEMTEEYLPIIEGRVAWAQDEVEARAEAAANPEQPTLL